MKLNRYAVTTVNYAAAAVAGAVAAAGGGRVQVPRLESRRLFLRRSPGFSLVSGGSFSPSAAPLWAGLYRAGYRLAFRRRLSALSVQRTAQRTLPLGDVWKARHTPAGTVLSLLVWRDFPDLGEWTGIALAAAALALPSFSSVRGAERMPTETCSTPACAAFSGHGARRSFRTSFSRLMPRRSSRLSSSRSFSLLLFCASLVLLDSDRKKVLGSKSCFSGSRWESPTCSPPTSSFGPWTASRPPSPFPFFSVGSMSLIALGGVILFRERLSLCRLRGAHSGRLRPSTACLKGILKGPD